MKKEKMLVFWILSLSVLWGACETRPLVVPKPPKPPKDQKGILFLGHIYRWNTASDRVDERIEQLELDCYEQLWLGGDICSETTEKAATIDYLDNMFDLSKPGTLWSLGNHDVRNGNLDWIRNATGRELHYAQNLPGMTVLVTNTTYKRGQDCNQMEDQMALIQKVCDTIASPSHLIMLTHHATWVDVEPNMNADGVGNAGAAWISYLCEPQSQFRYSIYPMLQAVQARGVQVVVISGDSGQKRKFYQHQTTDGIWFLASGINNSSEPDLEKRAQLPPDRLLYLQYDENQERLDWYFPDLDSLING